MPPSFKKRPTWRAEIDSTRRRCWTSSASSRGVQCVTGRSLSSGGSQATARIWVICSGVNLPGQPGRGRSRRSSSIARQGGVLLAAFDEDQALEGVGPPSPPDADGMAFTVEALRNGFIVQAVDGKQDHACALGEGLGTRAGAGHGLQDLLLPFRDNDLGGPPWHSSYLPKSR